MAAIQIPLATGATVRDKQKVKVYVRESWGDEWEYVPYLTALGDTIAACPSVSTANLLYRFGSIKWERSAVFTTYDPVTIRDWYVQIALTAPADGAETALFIGRLSGAGIEPFVGGNLGGDMPIMATGLEADLDRIMVGTSWVNGLGGLVEISKALTFNDAPDARYPRRLGNRSSGKNGDSYVFADGNTVWTALDMVEYLLVRHAPEDWDITIGGQTDALENLSPPRVEMAGKSVKRILDEIIDRRRGLGWRIVADAEDNVTLKVFTTTPIDISAAGVTVPANPDQLTILFDDRLDMDGVIGRDTLYQYGKIVCTGDPAIACFTLGKADGTLTAAWDTALEGDYKNVTGADAVEKDMNRLTPQFEGVFLQYAVPSGWDYKAAGGDGNRDFFTVVPLIDVTTGELPDFEVAAPTRNWGHTLLDNLPLYEADDETRGFMRPFALVKHPDDTAYPDRYFQLDQAPDGVDVSGSVSPLTHKLGVQMRVNGPLGSLNHYFARNVWVPAAEASQLTDPAEMLDPATLVVTVAMETDQRLQVETTISGGDPDRVLHIEVPGAKLHYIVPGTVVGLKEDDDTGGGALEFHAGGTLRTDAERLQGIVAAAAAWHGIERSTATVRISEIMPVPTVGTILSGASSVSVEEDVNSVITQVVHDFTTQTTTFSTGYEELDALTLTENAA